MMKTASSRRPKQKREMLGSIDFRIYFDTNVQGLQLSPWYVPLISVLGNIIFAVKTTKKNCSESC